jgi:hypothetical protein
MIDFTTGRRRVLKALISIPLAFLSGCKSMGFKSAAQEISLRPEESLKKLVMLLGPWSSADRKEAEDFGKRFLKAKHAIDPYLPGSNGLVQSLANRFPPAMAMKAIDLGNLPPDEQKLLLQLVKQLYSLIEVRFFAAHEPPWGECQGDRLRYTRAPRES